MCSHQLGSHVWYLTRNEVRVGVIIAQAWVQTVVPAVVVCVLTTAMMEGGCCLPGIRHRRRLLFR